MCSSLGRQSASAHSVRTQLRTREGANRGYQLGYHSLVTSLVNILVTSAASLHAVVGPGQPGENVNGGLLGLVVGATP